MSVYYRCDGPNCGATAACPGPCAKVEPARITALSVAGLRERTNSAESPVIWLPPVGWIDVITSIGARLHACSIKCHDDIIGQLGRDPQGPRRECAACGQVLSKGSGT